MYSAELVVELGNRRIVYLHAFKFIELRAHNVGAIHSVERQRPGRGALKHDVPLCQGYFRNATHSYNVVVGDSGDFIALNLVKITLGLLLRAGDSDPLLCVFINRVEVVTDFEAYNFYVLV